MLKVKAAISSFSVNDLAKAKEFYTKTLGLELDNEEMGMELRLPGGGSAFIYQKDGHQPATFTVLNLIVDNIDQAVDELQANDISFERYETIQQDEKGVQRGLSHDMGPDIAWFCDPAGNIVSLIQKSK
jgi:catechol 2,3-dioxygenase-like lactoylglutathione lyase family enzyme